MSGCGLLIGVDNLSPRQLDDHPDGQTEGDSWPPDSRDERDAQKAPEGAPGDRSFCATAAAASVFCEDFEEQPASGTFRAPWSVNLSPNPNVGTTLGRSPRAALGGAFGLEARMLVVPEAETWAFLSQPLPLAEFDVTFDLRVDELSGRAAPKYSTVSVVRLSYGTGDAPGPGVYLWFDRPNPADPTIFCRIYTPQPDALRTVGTTSLGITQRIALEYRRDAATGAPRVLARFTVPGRPATEVSTLDVPSAPARLFLGAFSDDLDTTARVAIDNVVIKLR